MINNSFPLINWPQFPRTQKFLRAFWSYFLRPVLVGACLLSTLCLVGLSAIGIMHLLLSVPWLFYAIWGVFACWLAGFVWKTFT